VDSQTAELIVIEVGELRAELFSEGAVLVAEIVQTSLLLAVYQREGKVMISGGMTECCVRAPERKAAYPLG